MTTPSTPSPNAPPPKLCTRCGTDCAGKPRMKDQRGRYTCQACVDQLMAKKASAGRGQSAEGASEKATAVAPSEPDGFDVFDLAPDPKESKTAPCPNCGKPVSAQAAVCVACGFSKQLGRLLRPSDTPKSDDLPRGKRIQCKKCDYDLRGLKTARCPECGTINTNPTRRERDKANSAEIARETYLKPLMYLAVGLLGMCLIHAFRFGGGPDAVVAYGLGYAIQLVIGLIVYLSCCAIWIGFDAPMHLTVLRIAGIYALVDLIGTVLSFIPIMGGIIGWIVGLLIYIGLLMDLLELDIQDTVIVALLTSVVRRIVFTVIVLKLYGLI